MRLGRDRLASRVRVRVRVDAFRAGSTCDDSGKYEDVCVWYNTVRAFGK